jgi:hypothetical protein
MVEEVSNILRPSLSVIPNAAKNLPFKNHEPGTRNQKGALDIMGK